MPAATEKQVKMAAKLYELRDRAKLLLGDAYKPRMAELAKIMEDTAKQNGKTVLDVAIAVAEKRRLIGMDLMMVMAAADELAEPSA